MILVHISVITNTDFCKTIMKKMIMKPQYNNLVCTATRMAQTKTSRVRFVLCNYHMLLLMGCDSH